MGVYPQVRQPAVLQFNRFLIIQELAIVQDLGALDIRRVHPGLHHIRLAVQDSGPFLQGLVQFYALPSAILIAVAHEAAGDLVALEVHDFRLQLPDAVGIVTDGLNVRDPAGGRYAVGGYGMADPLHLLALFFFTRRGPTPLVHARRRRDPFALGSRGRAGQQQDTTEKTHQAVSRSSASRYLAAVLSMTSGGSSGPGAVLSQSRVSR